MLTKLTSKCIHSAPILFTIVMIAFTFTLYNIVQVNAQTTSITVTGLGGTTSTYTLTQLKAMPAISGYGGFYQPNQNQINNGNWTGVSLLYLCNQVGGLTSTSNVTVTGQGINNFTYDMVANGLSLNPTYATYNDLTGAVQNQNQPVNIILAYLVNDTDVASNQAPRMVIVGPEGLLLEGSGGRSITQVNITGTAPASTPSPSPTSMPTPTPTPVPTSASQTPSPTSMASPSPSPSPTVSSSPKPVVSASPQPTGTLLSVESAIIITVIIIIMIIVVAAVFLARRKQTQSAKTSTLTTFFSLG
jgi:hypothetical protein